MSSADNYLTDKKLPRAACAEEVGVSGDEIQRLIDDMFISGIDLHSIMVLRRGKVACEAWRRPLSEETAHMSFSVAKSFFAAAFGFALSEGVITRDTKLIDVFPELRPKKTDSKLEKLRLYDLVSMTAGKRPSVLKRNNTSDDWLRDYINAPWVFSPGESWLYVSMNYYAASAALTRLMGMSISEYLTPRLYEPLGIDVPFWETSPQGIDAGGWGMYLKTEDIAKLITCYQHGGMFDGRQVIPESWAKEAVSLIHDTSAAEKAADCRAGYGCGFWRCAGMENTYRCEGLYSQYAIAFEDYDASLVVTCGHANLQHTLDVIWSHMKNAFIDGGEGHASAQIQIPPYDAPQESDIRPPLEKELVNKTVRIKRNLFLNTIKMPVGMLPMPVVFLEKDCGGNIDNVRFAFDEKGVNVTWTEDTFGENSIYFAMDGTLSRGHIYADEIDAEVLSYAWWHDGKTLELRVRPTGSVAERRLVFIFNGNKVIMKPDAVPGIDENAKTIGDKIKCILTNRYFTTWVDILVPRVKYILQPDHKGRLRDL